MAGEIGLSASEQLLVIQAQRDPKAPGNLATVITANALKPEELPRLERAQALAREAEKDSEVLKGYRAAAAVRRRGKWLNAPDGDGYILFDPVAQAPVMDKDRNMIRVRDSEVQGATARTRPAASDDNSGWDSIIVWDSAID